MSGTNSGAQVSLAGNIAQDGVIGAQVGGAVAVSYGPVTGVQASGYNMAPGGMKGAQLGWIANVATGKMHGAQVSLVNVTKGKVHGVQVGLANVVRSESTDPDVSDSEGTQIGLANVMTGKAAISGASVGLVNVAHKQHGVQIGLVNVADEFDGVQVGLVSVARKNSGVSIGLVPVVLDGENHLTLDWNTTGAANLGFKLGTRRVFISASVGITRDRELDGSRFCSSSFGFGIHAIPRDRRLFLDIGASATGFASGSSPKYASRMVSSLRVQVGYAIASHLAIVAGPILNVQTAWDNADRLPRGVSSFEQVWTSGGTTVRMYPGLIAGLEF